MNMIVWIGPAITGVILLWNLMRWLSHQPPARLAAVTFWLYVANAVIQYILGLLSGAWWQFVTGMIWAAGAYLWTVLVIEPQEEPAGEPV